MQGDGTHEVPEPGRDAPRQAEDCPPLPNNKMEQAQTQKEDPL
jgi:hypothetical protein